MYRPIFPQQYSQILVDLQAPHQVAQMSLALMVLLVGILHLIGAMMALHHEMQIDEQDEALNLH